MVMAAASLNFLNFLSIRLLFCTIYFIFFFIWKNWRIFVVLPLFLALCNGYKVLFLAPMNVKSISMYMSSFVTSLLDRGHEVTFLTSNSLKHLKLANYTEVLIDPPLNLLSKCKLKFLLSIIVSIVLNPIFSIEF